MKQGDFEKLTPTDEPVIRKLGETIERDFEDLLAALPPEKDPKTRTSVKNFLGAVLKFFKERLDHYEWPLFTTNVAESGFS